MRKEYILEKKISVIQYLVKILNGMALGLFSSLIIGLILRQIGILLNNQILIQFGLISQFLMGPAIGAGVAYAVKSNSLGIFASIICGAIGANTIYFVDGVAQISIGEPVGALIASLIGAEISKFIYNKSKLNVIIVPACTIILGGLSGVFISPLISSILSSIGIFINNLTYLKPIPMGMFISLFMGIILTLPISSAAISISLGLSGLAAGAATVGCSAHMIGFAFSSYRENKGSGLISQGLGTSMLQIGNIIKNPWIATGPVISSIILGPFSTKIFKMENNSVGGGMGSSGLVGQISTLEVMGSEASIFINMFLLHFLLPGLISFFISEFLRKKSLIKFGDMKI